MNYGFYFLACEFFTRDAKPMTAKEFDKRIWQQLKLYPLHANYLAMNLLGTHDTERIASLIVNRALKKYGGENPIATFFTNTHITDRGYTSRRPNDDERQLQRMMIAFEFSMIGSPMVYYGDELGMYGGNDPDCRKPMCWNEMKFEADAADMEMHNFYKRLIALRRHSKALMQGTMATDYASTKSRVWVISRRSGDERVIFAFNCDDEPANVRIMGLPGRVFEDYFDGGSVTADSKGAITFKMQPKTFRVLRSSNT
jgi:glycosidase